MTSTATCKFINVISFCDHKKLGKVKTFIYYRLYLFGYLPVTGKPFRLSMEHYCVQTRSGVASSLRLAVAQCIPHASNQVGKIDSAFRLILYCNVFF